MQQKFLESPRPNLPNPLRKRRGWREAPGEVFVALSPRRQVAPSPNGWRAPRAGWGFAFTTLTLLLLLTQTLRAQPCDTCPRSFRLEQDSFAIGAVGLLHPRIAKNELRIDFTRLYTLYYKWNQAPGVGDLARLLRESDSTKIPDWHDRLTWRFWHEAADSSIRFGVIAPLPLVDAIERSARSVEFYAAPGPDIHALDLLEVGTTKQFLPLIATSELHGLVGSVMVPSAFRSRSGPSVEAPIFIAGHPRGTAYRAFFRGEPELYALAGLPDRSTAFRIGFTMAVNELILPQLADLHDSTVIAYAHLYRRERSGQSVAAGDCRCGIFRRFDSIVVTKKNFLDTTLTPFMEGSGRFREVSKLVEMIRDTLRILTPPPGEFRNSYDHDTITGRALDFVVPGVQAYERLHVPLYAPAPLEHILGTVTRTFGPPTCDDETCERLMRAGAFGDPATLIRGDIQSGVPNEASDFDIRIYSTGVVPLEFLRVRIAQEMYDHLVAGRLDSLILRQLDSVLDADPKILPEVLRRFAGSDEPSFHTYRSGGYVARLISRHLIARGDTTHGLWWNPPGNFYGARLFSGDLHNRDVPTLHTIARQDYNGTIDGPIPVRYANPDSMHVSMMHGLYRVKDSVDGERIVAEKMIAFNTREEYERYTERRQRGFGSVYDAATPESNVQGPLVSRLTRAVDAARRRWSELNPLISIFHLTPKISVWNTIEPRGWINSAHKRNVAGGMWQKTWLHRPPTPEEITAQVWLTLNCGANGIIYTDGAWDGTQLGYIDAYSGEHSREYGPLAHPNPDVFAADSVAATLPPLWIGFRSRFAAIARVNAELKRLDSLVDLSRLVHTAQMSAHDPRRNFATFPFVDTIVALDLSTVLSVMNRAADPLDKTFIELTIFSPSTRDTAAVRADARYVLITNRRTWPIDTLAYGAAAQTWGAAPTGLRDIDIRRPILRLKNSWQRLVRTVRIEKVAHETEWPARSALIGTPIQLDALDPGWGALYKITPE